MVRRRLPAALLLPAVLVGLVALLATLQYRWLGQVSEAERDQLRRSLAQRSRELTDEFDREISMAYLALRLSTVETDEGDWSAFATALDRWRQTARHPRIIRGIYLAEPSGEHLALRRYDDQTRGFAPATTAWPPALGPLRARLEDTLPPPRPAPPGDVRLVTVALTTVAPDIPALVIPLVGPFPPGLAHDSAVTHRVRTPAPGAAGVQANVSLLPSVRSSLIVELDREYLAGTMLPALADRHFPRADAAGYRLAVVDAGGATLFLRGFPDGAVVDAGRADQVVPFFTLRADLAREPGLTATITARHTPEAGAANSLVMVWSGDVLRSRSPGSAPETPRVATEVFRARTGTVPGWRLVIQHGAGSLDAAVSHVRRRNLWLSFGILAVLGAGVVLVVANARRSEQLAARQLDFVATVSHELRTPLAVIRSAAQNLSAGVVADAPQARKYGELIENEGQRLTDMIEQVMAYAGLEGVRRVRSPRPVDLVSVVEGVAEACRPLCAAAGCELTVEAGDGTIPPVMGDEAALARVVQNLVANAAKHGADGRWVGLAVSACSVRGGHEVQITVSDRGRGIDPADLAHVFEPFHRGAHAVAQQIHGNGLGLHLVKRIAEAHGGRVAVTSKPGEGATFVVYLPAAAPPLEPDRGLA